MSESEHNEDPEILFKFIDRLQAGEYADADAQYRRTGWNPDIVDELGLTATRSSLFLPFNWTSWDKCRCEPEELDSLEDVRKLLTLLVRQDRFCGGSLCAVCSSGFMLRVLERLRHLYAESGV